MLPGIFYSIMCLFLKRIHSSDIFLVDLISSICNLLVNGEAIRTQRDSLVHNWDTVTFFFTLCYE